MKEVWKPVRYKGVDWPYRINKLGEVRNMEGLTIRPFLRGSRGGKYLAVHLHKNGRTKNVDVHRLVAVMFIPNPERKPEVNHKDLNHYNPVWTNLEWMTRSENELYKHFMEGVPS